MVQALSIQPKFECGVQLRIFLPRVECVLAVLVYEPCQFVSLLLVLARGVLVELGSKMSPWGPQQQPSRGLPQYAAGDICAVGKPEGCNSKIRCNSDVTPNSEFR